MKKLVVTLIVTMLFTATTFGADIDMSGMSVEELVELRNNVEAEIVSRADAPDTIIIPAGTYLVGEDVDAGKYLLTGIDEEKATAVSTYKSEDTSSSNVDELIMLDYGETQLLEFKDGAAVKIVKDIAIGKSKKLEIPG